MFMWVEVEKLCEIQLQNGIYQKRNEKKRRCNLLRIEINNNIGKESDFEWNSGRY